MMATTLVPKVTCSPASGPAMSPSAPAGPASDRSPFSAGAIRARVSMSPPKKVPTRPTQ